MAESFISPDCQQGKHRSCTGDGGWDDETDAPVSCHCACHPWNGEALCEAVGPVGWLGAPEAHWHDLTASLSCDNGAVVMFAVGAER